MSYQKYLNSKITPVSAGIQSALDQSPMPPDAFIPVERASELNQAGYAEIESGFCLNADGSITVAALTDMPNVTSAMWHWWFGWHGDSDDKYKLWHPPAHISAEWKDKAVGRQAYINRTSHVVEYIGEPKASAAIQFKHPSVLGLPEFDPETSDSVFIVARLGAPAPAVDIGWLVHQVRKTATGSEMRSRFWLGGDHFAGRNFLGRLLAPVGRRFQPIGEEQAAALLTHCAEEMSHLATFLPELYADLSES